jgi:hypothetical protein
MSNVVKFPFSVSRRAHARKLRASKNGTPEARASVQEMVDESHAIDDRPSARSLSTTAHNGHLRQERKEAWRSAEAATRYWSARLDFQSAVSWAQRMEIPEGRFHPSDPEDSDRMSMVEKWRAAFVKQLLTPAPDARELAWKQNALARGKYLHTGLKPERLKHAIAEDEAFLAAHPIRQSDRRQN